METEIKETGCCPIFDPSKWDNQVLEWDNKKFIKGNVFTIFYMPIMFGGVISKLFTNIKKEGGTCVDNMGLSMHKSPWNMELLLAVDKEIPHEENVTLSGKFFVRAYDGSFKDMKVFMDEYSKEAQEKGCEIESLYNWYTTCPKCAKAYGHNYILIFGKLK